MWKMLTPLLFMSLIFACGQGKDSDAQTNPSESAPLDVSGTWSIIDNECEDDDTDLVITQTGSDLTFSGSFSYQEGVSDSFTGNISSDTVTFAIDGTDSDADCTATVSGETLSGTCVVTGSASETCTFEYTK